MTTTPNESCHGGFRPGRLWSLWELMESYGETLFRLGLLLAQIEHGPLEEEYDEASLKAARSMSATGDLLAETLKDVKDGSQGARAQKEIGELREAQTKLRENAAELVKMRAEQREDDQGALKAMLPFVKHLGLDVTATLLNEVATKKYTREEVLLLRKGLIAELEKRLFIFLPSERAGYYENDGILSSETALKFPSCHQELKVAGTSFALGLSTAAVFHAMRAAEIGVRLVGKSLGVTFTYPIDLAEWGKIIGEIEEKIAPLKLGPRGHAKDADLQFYSHAAAVLRHFNNAWRIRASHARENFTDARAKEIIDHVRSLFELLAERLSEGAP